MSIDDNVYFEYLLKEYHSLADRLDSYAKSSFEDFKLLAVAGFIIAWPPVAPSLLGNGSNFTLFAGFVAVLLTVAAIDARDNLKHSVVRFYMSQAKKLEKEILAIAGRQGVESFHIVRNWDFWFEKKHKRLVHIFHAMVYVVVIGIPSMIMIAEEMTGHAIAFGVISLLVVLCMLYSVSVLRRSVDFYE